MDTCKILLYVSTSSLVKIFCSTQNDNAKIVYFSPYNFYNVYEYYTTNTMCDSHKYNFKNDPRRIHLENNLMTNGQMRTFDIQSFRIFDNKKNCT